MNKKYLLYLLCVLSAGTLVKLTIDGTTIAMNPGKGSGRMIAEYMADWGGLGVLGLSGLLGLRRQRIPVPRLVKVTQPYS